MCCLYSISIGLRTIKTHKIRNNQLVLITEFVFPMTLMTLLNNITSYYLTLTFLDEGCYNAVKNNKNMSLTEMPQTGSSGNIQTDGVRIPVSG